MLERKTVAPNGSTSAGVLAISASFFVSPSDFASEGLEASLIRELWQHASFFENCQRGTWGLRRNGTERKIALSKTIRLANKGWTSCHVWNARHDDRFSWCRTLQKPVAPAHRKATTLCNALSTVSSSVAENLRSHAGMPMAHRRQRTDHGRSAVAGCRDDVVKNARRQSGR